MNYKRWCDTHFLVLRVPKYIGKSKIECVIVTFTGHIHLFLSTHCVSLFATKEEKFSSRKCVLADLAIVCWG